MRTGLEGKVVIVTAATANIGRGIALAFAAEGARVVIVGRDPVAGELVAKLAREQGAADVLWRPADLTVHDDVAGMVADTAGRLRPDRRACQQRRRERGGHPVRVVDPRAVAG